MDFGLNRVEEGMEVAVQQPKLSALLFLALSMIGCLSSRDASATATIGESGGSLQLNEGVAAGASIDIPAGALVRDVQITMVGNPAGDDLPVGTRALGAVVTFGPDGQRFASPVHITIPAEDEPMVLYTRQSSGGEWSRVDGARWDRVRHVVEADVVHFSDYVPVGREEVDVDGGEEVDAGTPDDAGDPREDDGSVPTETRCDAFADPCVGATTCVPQGLWEPDSAPSSAWTVPVGVCVAAPGTASEGEPCFVTEFSCAPGLLCNAEFEAEPGVCSRVCDGAAHACPGANQLCANIFRSPDDFDTAPVIEAGSSDWGLCYTIPAPARECDVLTNSGCELGETCAASEQPRLPLDRVSQYETRCIAPGSVPAGGECTTSNACASGLSCASTSGWSTGAGEESHWYFTFNEGYLSRGPGICVEACGTPDWSASSCEHGQICHEVDSGGEALPFGVCYEPRG